MAEAGYIKYLQEAVVDQLRGNISANLKKYEVLEIDWMPELPADSVRTSSIAFAESLSIEMPEGDDKRDVENACTVYKAMRTLTPQQATDERIWVYLTHVHCPQYVRKRWPVSEKLNEQGRQRHIRRHYFISGTRGRIRDNAVSRLWWMGWIAERCTKPLKCDLEYLLEVLLYRQNVGTNLLDWMGLGTSPEIFKAVMSQLIADYKEIKNQKGKSDQSKGLLFQRDCFRKMMRQLNRAGGMVVLNALETDDLNAIVTDIVQKIKQDHKKEMASSKST